MSITSVVLTRKALSCYQHRQTNQNWHKHLSEDFYKPCRNSLASTLFKSLANPSINAKSLQNLFGDEHDYSDWFIKDQDRAERAYLSATDAGYSANEINVIMSEETRERYYGKNATLETEVGSKAAEGAAIVGAFGATASAIAAAVAAVGTALVLPSLGLVIAGALAAGIAGAGAGGFLFKWSER